MEFVYTQAQVNEALSVARRSRRMREMATAAAFAVACVLALVRIFATR